jgi:hypothetical protein
MADWTTDELEKIAAADELQLAPTRSDGSLPKPVTIWVVRVGEDFYVRSWRGRTGSWFRGARQTHEGHISAGGIDKDVRFIEAGDDVNDAVDNAYRSKYRRYADSYVEPMVRPEARATTIRLVLGRGLRRSELAVGVAVLVVFAPIVAATPETVTRTPGAAASLRPHVGVPAAARRLPPRTQPGPGPAGKLIV